MILYRQRNFISLDGTAQFADNLDKSIVKNLNHIKNKISKLCEEFCEEHFNIKLVFVLFKIKDYFSNKDPVTDDLKSFLEYKFTCASYSSTYIGKTYCHFKTRTEEHTKKVNKLIFLNIYTPPQYGLTRIIFFLLK